MIMTMAPSLRMPTLPATLKAPPEGSCSRKISVAAALRPASPTLTPGVLLLTRSLWLGGQNGLCRRGASPPLGSSRAPQRRRVSAEGGNVEKVLGLALKTGKQGLDAGVKLVPESVPRPVAVAGISLVGFLVITTAIKTLFSTVFSLVVVAGLGYGAFIYFTRGGGGDDGDDSGPPKRSSSPSSSDPLEDARRIMEKYK